MFLTISKYSTDQLAMFYVIYKDDEDIDVDNDGFYYLTFIFAKFHYPVYVDQFDLICGDCYSLRWTITA